jgi:hypothetical protein
MIFPQKKAVARPRAMPLLSAGTASGSRVNGRVLKLPRNPVISTNIVEAIDIIRRE